MKEKKKLWHKEVITKAVETTIRTLRRRNVLSEFYLAGGTGLALYFGHRRSVDLDFFSRQSFSEDDLLKEAQRMRGFALIAKGRETLHTHIKGTKVSFLGYPYPLLFPFGSFLGIKIADPRDIAGMKISAIASRGSKRDFVDLYVASKEYGLANLLDAFKKKFVKANYSTIHVLKSLTYFEDAEKEPMPDMLVNSPWPEIKEFFNAEVPRLLKS